MTKALTSFGRAAIVALVATALLAGCGGEGSDGSVRAGAPTATAGKSSTQAELTDVASVDQFAALFNEKQGVPRLVLLLSPT